MKKERLSEEQIVRIPKEVDAGTKVETCRKRGISAAAYYHWKARYAGMDALPLRCLEELEAEIAP